jgi:hypothetical protein
MPAKTTLHHRVVPLIAALAVVFPAVGRAEIIKFEDMRRGTTVTEVECGSRPNTVWVSAYGRNVCMRYYFSDAGGGGPEATIFINGDKPGVVPNKIVKPEVEKDTDTDAMDRAARKISRLMGQPGIYLARMGLDGSSGHHAQRHTNLELQITNEAIEAIKRHHGFARLNIYGQSGGASLIGGLVAMRNDLNCAVPGSGRLVASQSSITRNNSVADPALAIINPYDGVAEIARNSTAKIWLVTDPDDSVVMRKYQDPFVWGLRDAGRQVDQFYVSAADPQHHGVVKYAAAAVRECIRGSTREQVAEVLANVAQKIAEARSQNQPQSTTESAARPPGPVTEPTAAQ